MKLGLEVLAEQPDSWRGSRVGLLAHAASRLPTGEHALTVLQGLGLEVVRLFSPEHSFFGATAARAEVDDAAHAGVPLISLYGARRSPEP